MYGVWPCFIIPIWGRRQEIAPKRSRREWEGAKAPRSIKRRKAPASEILQAPAGFSSSLLTLSWVAIFSFVRSFRVFWYLIPLQILFGKSARNARERTNCEERARKNRLRGTRAKEPTARKRSGHLFGAPVYISRGWFNWELTTQTSWRSQWPYFLSLLLYILYLFFIYSFIFIIYFYLFFFLFDPVQYIFIPVTICSCSRHVKDIAGHLASLPDRRLPRMRTILQRQFRKDLPQFLQRPAKGMLKVAWWNEVHEREKDYNLSEPTPRIRFTMTVTTISLSRRRLGPRQKEQWHRWRSESLQRSWRRNLEQPIKRMILKKIELKKSV